MAISRKSSCSFRIRWLPFLLALLVYKATASPKKDKPLPLDSTDGYDDTYNMGAPWDAFWRPLPVDVDWGSDCRADCGFWTDAYSGVEQNDGYGSKPKQNLQIPHTHFTLVADWKLEREEEKLGIAVYRQLDRSPRYWYDRFEILCNGTGGPGRWMYGGGQLWEYKYMRTFRDMTMEFLVHGGNFCETTFGAVWRPDKWDNLWVRYLPLGWKDNLFNFADDPRCEKFGEFENKVRCVGKYHIVEDADELWTEVPCLGPGCGPELGVAEVGDDAAALDKDEWKPGPEDDCEKMGFTGEYTDGTKQWRYDWVCRQQKAGCDGGACGVGEEPKFPPPERPIYNDCKEVNVTLTNADGTEGTQTQMVCGEEGKDDKNDDEDDNDEGGKNGEEDENEEEDKDEEEEEPLLADVG